MLTISRIVTLLALWLIANAADLSAQSTQKPPLHGRHWLAITGKPLAATSGSMIFQKGGNAIDAAVAMLASSASLWDSLSWGGETQALIYNPNTGEVIAINALGVAPTGATPEYFQNQDMRYPPGFGPLASVTPGTPGGLMVMLAEYGTLSLADVLGPSIEIAKGFPVEVQLSYKIEDNKDRINEWKYTRQTLLPSMGHSFEAPRPGEILRQPDLVATLEKLVESESEALASGKNRKEAIYAAYDRFYTGDIAKEIARGIQEEGGLITLEDLANWEVRIEKPLSVNYRGFDVYKLTHWTQGPALLQTLNILESYELKEMGYNSAKYIHTLYQAMNLALADRDFYYGDPYFPPEEPIKGLLSKGYALQRASEIDLLYNDYEAKPGDPYPFQGDTNPFREYLRKWTTDRDNSPDDLAFTSDTAFDGPFFAGTTSIQAADAEGWVVSITPSGGWIPAVIAGHTGIGLSQRMQSFVVDPSENPYNVVEPGKQPRVTLTPTLVLRNGKPFLSFAVQGGDSQEQNQLQFFLNMVEFHMTVQEATEAANFNSFQMRESFGEHNSFPGRILLRDDMPPWIRKELRSMGYELTFSDRTSGPINAIFFDQEHDTLWGGSSNFGEDTGIAW